MKEIFFGLALGAMSPAPESVLVEFQGKMVRDFKAREAIHQKIGGTLVRRFTPISVDQIKPASGRVSRDALEKLCERYLKHGGVKRCELEEVHSPAQRRIQHATAFGGMARRDPKEETNGLDRVTRDACPVNSSGETSLPAEWGMEYVGGDSALIDEAMKEVKGTVNVGLMDTGYQPGAISDIKADKDRMAAFSSRNLNGLTPHATLHGTQVANLINGQADGVSYGPGKNTRITALAVFHKTGDGLEAIKELRASKQPPKIVNMSVDLGSSKILRDNLASLMTGIDPTTKERFLKPEERMILVAASGNSYPAPLSENLQSKELEDVIVAGGSGPWGTAMPMAQTSPRVDILAPGEFLTTLTPQGPTEFQGTSGAAPIVSGAVGNLAASVPDLAPAEARRLVRATGQPVSNPIREGGDSRMLNALALAEVGKRLSGLCQGESVGEEREKCRKGWIDDKTKKVWTAKEKERSLFDFSVEAKLSLDQGKQILADAKGDDCEKQKKGIDQVRRAFLLANRAGASEEEKGLVKESAAMLSEYYKKKGFPKVAAYYGNFATGAWPTVEKQLPVLAARLNAEDISTSETAARALADLGAAGKKVLKQELPGLISSKKAIHRAVAPYALRVLGSDPKELGDVVKKLTTLAEDENPGVRFGVLEAAEGLYPGNSEAILPLFAKLLKDDAAVTAIAAFNFLAGKAGENGQKLVKTPEGIAALKLAIGSSDEDIRVSAIEGAKFLFQDKKDELIPILEEAAQDTAPFVRYWGVKMLSDLQSDKALEALKGIALSENFLDDTNRMLAISGAFNFKEKGAALFRDMLKKAELPEAVRKYAVAEGLKKLPTASIVEALKDEKVPVEMKVLTMSEAPKVLKAKAVPVLEAGAVEREHKVREAAVRAAISLRAEGLPVLVTAMKAKDMPREHNRMVVSYLISVNEKIPELPLRGLGETGINFLKGELKLKWSDADRKRIEAVVARIEADAKKVAATP